VTELRILTDTQLVGNLHYASFDSDMGRVAIFVSSPSVDITAISKRYGRASVEKTDKDSLRYIAYGRVRLVADPSGKIVVVCYHMPKD
jgi:hypothetical protein